MQPDIVVICDREKVSEDGNTKEFPPSSWKCFPSTKGKDMTVINLYMKSGVSEYWIVDLDGRQILQYAFLLKTGSLKA